MLFDPSPSFFLNFQFQLEIHAFMEEDFVYSFEISESKNSFLYNETYILTSNNDNKI